MIWLGILATWVVLAIVVGLALARMMMLRDRQRPDSTKSGPLTEDDSGPAKVISPTTRGTDPSRGI